MRWQPVSQYSFAVADFEAYHCINTTDWGLRKVLPDENLENCKKEEVLEYCKPYAEVFGYTSGNSEAEVYAMTLDKLENTEFKTYAPYKGLNNTEILSEEQCEKLEECPWSREDEAFYIVYKPVINGLFLVCCKWCMLHDMAK